MSSATHQLEYITFRLSRHMNMNISLSQTRKLISRGDLKKQFNTLSLLYFLNLSVLNHTHPPTNIQSHSHSSVLAQEQLYFNWGQWTGNAHE